MEKILQKILAYGGLFSLSTTFILYLYVVYKVINDHWTFFGEGVGDLLVFMLLSVVLLLLYLVYRFAIKHDLHWLHAPIMVVSLTIIVLTTLNLGVLTGEDLRRDEIAKSLRKPPPRGIPAPAR
jgi:hypothetical protein